MIKSVLFEQIFLHPYFCNEPHRARGHSFIVYYYNNIAPLIFISQSCIQENIHHLVMDHWETFLLIIPLTCGLKLHSDRNFFCRSIQDFMLLQLITFPIDCKILLYYHIQVLSYHIISYKDVR